MTGHLAYIGLGSNLQGPQQQLQRAFADLDGLPGTRLHGKVLAVSQCAAGLS